MSPLNREDRDAFIKAILEVEGSAAPARRPSGQDASEKDYDLDPAEARALDPEEVRALGPEKVRSLDPEELKALDPEEVRARIAIVDDRQRDSVLSLGGFLKSTFKKALLARYPFRPWWW
jgi:hypothetical protein